MSTGQRYRKKPDEILARLPNENELYTIINTGLTNTRDKALACLLYITGARINELLLVTPKNFYVSEDNKVRVELFVEKKRKRTTRIVPIPNNDFWLKGKAWLDIIKPNQKLFDFNRHRAYQIISRLTWLGLPVYPHLLRHIRNNKLIQLGFTDKQRMKYFSWSSPQPAYEFVIRQDIEKSIYEDKPIIAGGDTYNIPSQNTEPITSPEQLLPTAPSAQYQNTTQNIEYKNPPVLGLSEAVRYFLTKKNN